MPKLISKRSNNELKNNPKHDSEKQWKISSNGRPDRRGNQRSPKGAATVPKASLGPPWNSGVSPFFPHTLKALQGRPNVPKGRTKGCRWELFLWILMFSLMISWCVLVSPRPATPQNKNKKSNIVSTYFSTLTTPLGGWVQGSPPLKGAQTSPPPPPPSPPAPVGLLLLSLILRFFSFPSRLFAPKTAQMTPKLQK